MNIYFWAQIIHLGLDIIFRNIIVCRPMIHTDCSIVPCFFGCNILGKKGNMPLIVVTCIIVLLSSVSSRSLTTTLFELFFAA